MVVVVAKHFVPAERREEYIGMMKKFVKDTNDFDRGCILFELYESEENPNVITVIEKWEDADCIDEHKLAPHFTAVLPQFVEKRDVTRYISL